MRILGRGAESLDISPVRYYPTYKVIVYQKDGDCRREEFKKLGCCQNNCHGIYMSVEFSLWEDGVLLMPEAVFPPFEYIDGRLKLVYGMENIRELDEFWYRYRLPVSRRAGTAVYRGGGGEIVGVERRECGMGGVANFLPVPKEILDEFPFFGDIVKTYRSICINLSHFERNKRQMSEDEKLREASKVLDSPEMRELLSLRFGSEFISKVCLLYTSPSPRDRQKSRMPSSA